MEKDDETIMVIKKDKLFSSGKFQGFREHGEFDYLAEITKSAEWKKRGEVEQDMAYKQVIPYVVIFNPKTKKFFFFRRANKEENYREKRLYGRWSFGAGGHVSKEDAENLLGSDPIRANILREIKEEIRLNGNINQINIKGYINDESDEVGNVHFGLFHIIETDSEKIEPSDECSIVEFKMIDASELEDYLSDPTIVLEQWSRIASNFLKKI
jgi:predicted NUDIX family phosphoesterase